MKTSLPSLLLGLASILTVTAQQSPPRPPDAVDQATEVRAERRTRPEQKLTEHDQSDIFKSNAAPPASQALKGQPQEGAIKGFDFARDPLDAPKPEVDPEAMKKADIEARLKVNADQRRLLEARYDLKMRPDPVVTMSRGKPLARGPTARLAKNETWDSLPQKSPDDIKAGNLFPYPPLPHPKHATGGQVFPEVQLAAFPRLRRFDVDFDIPEEFLPEFPPAMFLQNRPELGDVSRGEVISINNFHRLFKDLLTPVQLDGLRLLLTPMPQEEFNATDDRKTEFPSLGVSCLDCHVNGHTTGQFHLTPDIRPQNRRFRIDTNSLRGLFNQQVFGSKRSLRSVEDFTEFEQRTAYFNGDQIHAFKKGVRILSRIEVSHMAQFQNMLDFPPVPKLNPFTGRLDRSKATEEEARGEDLFFGKAQCANCHSAPSYLDHQYHDLHLERFLNEPGDGPIKTFTLRGIKDSPPYLHDGRCLTLEDTVEFFNLVLELKLTAEEKKAVSAFLKVL